MREFETHEFIGQKEFVDTANELLDQATDPNAGLEDAISAAQSVNAKITEIKDGSLVVKPPLSEEQITNYQERSATIISLGQKAVAALQETGKGRPKRGKRGLTKTVSGAAKAAASYTGVGSAAKS